MIQYDINKKKLGVEMAEAEKEKDYKVVSVPVFGEPAKETDSKVKEWFISDREALNHHVAFGKTSEGLSHPFP